MLGGVPRSRRSGEAQAGPGPPLLRARMEREPDLRHHPPDLFAASPTSCSARSRRSRGWTRRRGTSSSSRPGASSTRWRRSNFALTNPTGAQAHARDARRESAQGPRQHAQGHRGGAIVADQEGRVRGRPQPRHDAGQGHPRDPALPADPVHADDRRGAQDPGDHLPAVDQPLLHPRPDAREKLRQLVRRAGHFAVHGQLEIGRREHRRRRPRRLCARRPDRRDRHGARRARSRERRMSSAIASPGRRSPRRSPISRPRARRPRSSRATFFTAQVDFSRGRRPQAVPRRRDHGAAARN